MSGQMPGSDPVARQCVVVGVTSRQADVVVRTAARLARALGTELVCAHVDTTGHVVEEHADGSVDARPLDPDVADWTGPSFDPELARRMRRLAADADVRLHLRELAGDAARGLGRLAELVDASLIVVGSRSGPRATMHEFLGGSVAAHLAHRQTRPVVVVPLAARAAGPLPWEDGE